MIMMMMMIIMMMIINNGFHNFHTIHIIIIHDLKHPIIILA